MSKFLIYLTLVIIFSFSCANNQVTSSPTETLKLFIQASKNKDVETLKQVLSKDSWKMTEDAAKEQGKTIEESIKENSRGDILEKIMSEFGKETINGEEAIVEVKNSINGEWSKIDFIKEDGKWKVDLAKPIKEAEKLFDKELK